MKNMMIAVACLIALVSCDSNQSYNRGYGNEQIVYKFMMVDLEEAERPMFLKDLEVIS